MHKARSVRGSWQKKKREMKQRNAGEEQKLKFRKQKDRKELGERELARAATWDTVCWRQAANMVSNP